VGGGGGGGGGYPPGGQKRAIFVKKRQKTSGKIDAFFIKFLKTFIKRGIINRANFLKRPPNFINLLKNRAILNVIFKNV